MFKAIVLFRYIVIEVVCKVNSAGFTLTLQEALPPAASFAVMVTLPSRIPNTVPLASTLAMSALLLDQVTFLLVSLDETIGFMVIVVPAGSDVEDVESFNCNFVYSSFTIALNFVQPMDPFFI